MKHLLLLLLLLLLPLGLSLAQQQGAAQKLLFGQTAWWLARPGFTGADVFYDALPLRAHLVLDDSGINPVARWSPTDRVGGVAHLVFDGVGNYGEVAVELVTLFGPDAQPATLCAWIKPMGAPVSGPDNDPYNLPTAVGDTGGYLGITRGTLTTDGDGIYVHNYDGTDARVRIPYTVDVWVHVCWWHSNGQLAGYKNGQFIGQVASGPAQSDHGMAWRVGAGYLSTFFAGAIDDVRTWNRALAPEEIQLVYAQSSTGPRLEVVALPGVTAPTTNPSTFFPFFR